MSIGARATAISTIASGPSLVSDGGSALVLVVIRLTERLLFAGALVEATGNLGRAALLALATTVLHIGRSLLVVRLRITRRIAIETRGASAVLAAEPDTPLEGADVDVFATFLEGTELLLRLLVDLIPDAVGDACATLVLVVIVVSRVPGHDVALLGALLLLATGVAAFARRLTAARAARAWEANGPFWKRLRAVLGARHEIVATGAVRAAERELDFALAGWAREERSYRLLAGITGRLPWLVVGTGLAIAFVARSSVGVDGQLLRECSLLAGVGAPLAALAGALHEAAKSEPGIARFLRLTAHPVVEEVPPTPLRRPREIIARELGYRYVGGTRDALTGASFVWRQGRVLAIGGVNGAGKSTLLRLLLRLAVPASGSLTVDGAAWSSIADASWRANVAYVAQAPYIDEEMSVRDFARLLAPDAEDAALEKALKRVDVWDRLAREREPLEVPLRILSAGMRQRVVLARALATDRSVVLLDEPDASLDADGVAKLAILLKELAQDRLVAVVAHAPALLAAADDRVVLGRTSS